ncbi:hypothetical protein Sgly_1073 [Syntrophobotulus glycolicus DSM 8271]|uniref:DUF2922 domain-containing protein n=1 Tax=Syntrophobotulus glycolicus (strain DSM 8271 / FlGlyR) TaxID=645991 RepID=F0STV9_SYNGF|nr:DUF2922 domain-containing protein [Syntrophobotulus glycolicus]ADY55399.1 hypothetical protein Sgly_1073 [Syntrophobotulus glycolicus DSM 8271]
MATSTNKIVRMVFSTQTGSTFSITLPQPRESLTAAEAETVMDLVISKNIFTTSGGDLTGKRDLKIVDTTTTDLFDPIPS